jgi:glycine oxidase
MKQLTCDCAILGGGVIGLCLARQLAGCGVRVAVVERGEFGREASWAGAGILPPAAPYPAAHPYDQLRALSFQLHAQWAEELYAETGIDPQYRRCGGLYVAETIGEAAALRGLADQYAEENIPITRWGRDELQQFQPALLEAWDQRRIRAVYYVPDEAQVRNPRFLAALLESCRKRGVLLWSNFGEGRWNTLQHRILSWQGPSGCVAADTFCVAAGAWTYPILRTLQLEPAILPIRGQMVLFAPQQPVLTMIVNVGSRYLVPRIEGLVLAGSTEEEAGYCKQTTPEAVQELTQFARRVVPALEHAPVVRTWAGLRPGSFDGLPYLGRALPWENLFVAAGHFRSGLYLAPATAVVMAEAIMGQKPRVDLGPFSLRRAICRPASLV